MSWELADSRHFSNVNLNAAENQIHFKGLEGNKYDYRVVAYMHGQAVASADYFPLTINDGAYGFQSYNIIGGATASASKSVPPGYASYINLFTVGDAWNKYDNFAIVEILGATGENRYVRSFGGSYAAGTPSVGWSDLFYVFSPDEVTKLTVKNGNGTNSTGEVYLWRRLKSGQYNSDGYELIQEQEVSAQDISATGEPVVFNNLKGDTDEEYRIEFEGSFQSGGSNGMRVYFQTSAGWDDTDGNYRVTYMYHNNASNLVSGTESKPFYLMANFVDDSCFAAADIHCKTGQYTTMTGHAAAKDATNFQFELMSYHLQNTDEFLGLKIVGISTNTVTGTFRLYKRSKQRETIGKRLLYDYDIAAGAQPDEVDGLVLWLDASKESYSDGEDVTTWTDQSGNGNHLTQSGPQCPTFRTNVINRCPAVSFDGTEFMTRIFSSTITQPVTIFCVHKWDDTNLTQNHIYDGNNSNRLVLYRNTANGYAMYSNAVFTTTETQDTDWHIATSEFNTSSSKFWLDGNSGGTGNVGTTSCDAFRVGASSTPNNGLVGDIAEILFFDSELSSVDRTKVEGYLSKKYNISVGGVDFSAGHTFENLNPDKMYEICINDFASDSGTNVLSGKWNEDGSAGNIHRRLLRANGVNCTVDYSTSLSGFVAGAAADSNYVSQQKILFYPKFGNKYPVSVMRRWHRYSSTDYLEYDTTWWANDTDKIHSVQFYANATTRATGNIKIYEIDLAEDTWTTEFSITHNNQSDNLGDYTVRQLIPATDITRSGNRVKVTFQGGTTEGWVVDNASIVERSGSTGDGTEVPTELLFNGSSGFSLGIGETITSDELEFEIDESKDYLVVMDFSSSFTPDRSAYISSPGTFYYKASTDSYDQQTVVGLFSWVGTVGVTKFEVRVK